MTGAESAAGEDDILSGNPNHTSSAWRAQDDQSNSDSASDNQSNSDSASEIDDELNHELDAGEGTRDAHSENDENTELAAGLDESNIK